MPGFRVTLDRLAVPVFAVLACLLAWAFYLAEWLGASIAGGQFPLGPILAAGLVSLLLGRPGLKAWAGRLSRLLVPGGWYLLAVLAPIALVVGAVLVNHAFGAPLPDRYQLAGWPGIGPQFVSMLLWVGIGEEAGWTAFAAPRLLERRGVLGAWLVLGSIRTIWHLPLMATGDLSLTLGIGGNFAFQFLLLWLLVRTDSWFLAAVWHAVLNAVSGSFFFRMVTGADQARLGTLMVAGYAAFALAVAWFDRRRLFPAPCAVPDQALAAGR
ncbi:MAG: CPBP family intramembrane glutamic endopeptidase [Gemmatimonadales bacterium]